MAAVLTLVLENIFQLFNSRFEIVEGLGEGGRREWNLENEVCFLYIFSWSAVVPPFSLAVYLRSVQAFLCNVTVLTIQLWYVYCEIIFCFFFCCCSSVDNRLWNCVLSTVFGAITVYCVYNKWMFFAEFSDQQLWSLDKWVSHFLTSSECLVASSERRFSAEKIDKLSTGLHAQCYLECHTTRRNHATFP